jgi:hypothetical protein
MTTVVSLEMVQKLKNSDKNENQEFVKLQDQVTTPMLKTN